MSADDLVNDLRREADKALGVLIEVGTYLTAHAEMNAALHCASDRVMYSPLHAKVTLAVHSLNQLLDRAQIESEQPIRADEEVKDAHPA